jgi:hypothetical protein
VVLDFSKSGTGTGESPRFRTNRGRGRGSVPAPGQIGDGRPVPVVPGQIGDRDGDGDGDGGVRALTQPEAAVEKTLGKAGLRYYLLVTSMSYLPRARLDRDGITSPRRSP